MIKDLVVDKNLINLAQIFSKNGHTLYIVGGFVRNALMGFCETDIDICSSATLEQVESMLRGTEYRCVLVNPALGTLHIFDSQKTVEYEHTTFRAEVYNAGGEHSPSEVRFVDDIRLDASRRDFSANALYYDILTHEIRDFYDGIECIKHHVLKTVETPERVFSRDGLRILRMARIASELDFEIDRDTLVVASQMVSQLGFISQERFNKEIVSMIFADNKYQSIVNFGMQSRGVRILGEIDAWRYVLTDFWQSLDTTRQQKMNAIEWELLSIAPPALRIACFVIDMLNSIDLEPTEECVTQILGVKGVILNKKEVARQYEIIKAYFAVKGGTLGTDKLVRLFLQANSEYNRELFGLLKLSGLGQNIIKTYSLMLEDKVPFSLKELAVNGNDLRENFADIPPRYYSQILAFLLNLCAVMPEMNDKEKLLDSVWGVYSKIAK